MTWSVPCAAWAASPSAISSGVPTSAFDGVWSSAGLGGRLIRIPNRDADRDRRASPDRADPRAGVHELAADPRETLVRQPEPGEVPGVGVAGGQLEHPRTLGGDEDRQVRAGRREQDGVAGL